MSIPKSPQNRKAQLAALKDAFPDAFEGETPDLGRLIDECTQLCQEALSTPCLTWGGKWDALQMIDHPIEGRLMSNGSEISSLGGADHVLIEGDNLEVLKTLLKTHADGIKLMYIDPPYNTGKGFIYNDSFEAQIPNETGAVDATSRWLSFLFPRLMVAKQLLKRDGVIFVSIDDNAFGHLKLLMDDIFGVENHITTFVWRRSGAGGLRGKFPVSIHEYVLCYAKDKSTLEGRWFAPYSKSSAAAFSHKDSHGRFKTQALYLSTLKAGENQRYPIRLPNGTLALPPGAGVWRFIESTFHQKHAAGEILFLETPNSPLVLKNGDKAAFNIYTKQYMDSKGSNPPSILPDDLVGQTRTAKSEIRKLFNAAVFDYPKPVSLIQYLLSLVPCEEGSICLDFFAGSGSTAHAVVELNHASSKRLRSISIQSPEPIPENHVAYSEGYRVISDITQERIRRVIPNDSSFLSLKHVTSAD